ARRRRILEDLLDRAGIQLLQPVAEQRRSGPLRLGRLLWAVHEPGHLACEHPLRLALLRRRLHLTVQLPDRLLVEEGEEAERTPHVRVAGLNEELPQLVGAGPGRIEVERALFRLAELLPRRVGDERLGEPVRLDAVHAADE